MLIKTILHQFSLSNFFGPQKALFICKRWLVLVHGLLFSATKLFHYIARQKSFVSSVSIFTFNLLHHRICFHSQLKKCFPVTSLPRKVFQITFPHGKVFSSHFPTRKSAFRLLSQLEKCFPSTYSHRKVYFSHFPTWKSVLLSLSTLEKCFPPLSRLLSSFSLR